MTLTLSASTALCSRGVLSGDGYIRADLCQYRRRRDRSGDWQRQQEAYRFLVLVKRLRDGHLHAMNRPLHLFDVVEQLPD
jgi:hypothetical protein